MSSETVDLSLRCELKENNGKAPVKEQLHSAVDQRRVKYLESRIASYERENPRLEQQLDDLVEELLGYEAFREKLPENIQGLIRNMPNGKVLSADENTFVKDSEEDEDLEEGGEGKLENMVETGEDNVKLCDVKSNKTIIADAVRTVARKMNEAHIRRLHMYNEVRDVGLALFSMLAEQRGVRLYDIQSEYGLRMED